MLLWKSMNIRKKMDSVPLHWTVWRDLYLQIGLAIFIIRRQSTGQSKRIRENYNAEEILKSKKGEKRADHYSTFFLPSFETYFLYEILRK